MTRLFSLLGIHKETWPRLQRTNCVTASFLEDFLFVLFMSPYKWNQMAWLFQTFCKRRLIKISYRWNNALCFCRVPLSRNKWQKRLNSSLLTLWQKPKVVSLLIWPYPYLPMRLSLACCSHGLGVSWDQIMGCRKGKRSTYASSSVCPYVLPIASASPSYLPVGQSQGCGFPKDLPILPQRWTWTLTILPLAVSENNLFPSVLYSFLW